MKRSKHIAVCVKVWCLLVVWAIASNAGFVMAGVPLDQDTPITPNASPETQSLFAFFKSIYGKRILSGQQEGHAADGQREFEFNHIWKVSGKTPAIHAFDLSPYTPPSAEDSRLTVTQQAMDWYLHSNGVVAICWHWHAPIGVGAIYSKDTSFDLRLAVTDGTPEHDAAMRDIDAIAVELKKLRDAHVPVLWRPLHEANGRWFWWGAQGPEPFKEMWRLMFDRLVNYHHLNNLIWVFSPGAAVDLADWYPGDEYVDIIGQDNYPMDKNTGPAKEIFDQLVAFSHGNKFVALSENGPIPNPDALVNSKAGWLFFTTWSGRSLVDLNSDEHLAKVYDNPYVMNLDNLPDLKRFAYKKTGKAVKLGFLSPPSALAIDGAGRQPVTVAVEDKQGRIVRSGEFKICLATGNNTSGGTLDGTLAVDTINGVATFPDLKIDQPGAYTLAATTKNLGCATSTAFNVGPGTGILREWWTDISGAQIRDLNDRLVTDRPPAGSQVLNSAFEVPYKYCTNFGERICGYISPPLTGLYVFEIVNDGTSELWLSSDETPGTKIKVAEITGRTPYSKWPHSHEAWSDPIQLVGGKHYYIEVLHAQHSGGAELWVSWRRPDGTFETPIPAANLSCPDAEHLASNYGENKLSTVPAPNKIP